MHKRLYTQAQQLDEDLRRYIDHKYYGPKFQRKEQELSNIRKELHQIEANIFKPPPPSSQPTLDPFSPYSSCQQPIQYISLLTHISNSSILEEETSNDEQDYVDLSTIAMVEQVETSHRSPIVEEPSFEKEGEKEESRSSRARNLEDLPLDHGLRLMTFHHISGCTRPL
ncbi:hypothetical protein K1719_039802 [Acacia pycnantha]|nr:hypothetical protein K1719_039802 [Acacia pycnantha]